MARNNSIEGVCGVFKKVQKFLFGGPDLQTISLEDLEFLIKNSDPAGIFWQEAVEVYNKRLSVDRMVTTAVDRQGLNY